MDNDENKQVWCPYANMQLCNPNAGEVISLLDVWNVLWGRRLLISIITVLVTLSASAYASFSPKNFEVKMNISPTSDHGLQLLCGDMLLINPMLSENEKIAGLPSQASIFGVFNKNLQDTSLQSEYLAQSEIIRKINARKQSPSFNISTSWFAQNLSVNNGTGEDKIVILTGGNPEAMAEVLNDFVSYVEHLTRHDLRNNLQENISKAKSALSVKALYLRKIAKMDADIQIAKLLEQKDIAEKLNIIEVPSNLDGPVYSRGVKALQAEINTIGKRVNNDMLIDGLPAILEKLKSIDNVDFSMVDLPVLIEQEVLSPSLSNNINRRVLILLGLASGLTISVSVAFFLDFLKRIHVKTKNGHKIDSTDL